MKTEPAQHNSLTEAEVSNQKMTSWTAHYTGERGGPTRQAESAKTNTRRRKGTAKHKTSAKPDGEHVKGMYGNMAANGNGPQVRQSHFLTENMWQKSANHIFIRWF